MLVGQDVYVVGFNEIIRYEGIIKAIHSDGTFEVLINKVITLKETKRREGLSISFAAKWVTCTVHSWYIKGGMLANLIVCDKCGKEKRYENRD